MIIISKFAPLVLFYIMLGIGMNTNIKKFVEVLKNLKVLLIGLISQIIILPSIGFLFAIFLTNDPVLKIGIILITSMPSAVTSNYITKISKWKCSFISFFNLNFSCFIFCNNTYYIHHNRTYDGK